MNITDINIKNENGYYKLEFYIKVPFYKNSKKYADKIFDELYDKFEGINTYGFMWSWTGYEHDAMYVSIYFSDMSINEVAV